MHCSPQVLCTDLNQTGLLLKIKYMAKKIKDITHILVPRVTKYPHFLSSYIVVKCQVECYISFGGFYCPPAQYRSHSTNALMGFTVYQNSTGHTAPML